MVWVVILDISVNESEIKYHDLDLIHPHQLSFVYVSEMCGILCICGDPKDTKHVTQLVKRGDISWDPGFTLNSLHYISGGEN